MNEMLFRELDLRARDFLVAVDSTMRTDRALPPARAARAGPDSFPPGEAGWTHCGAVTWCSFRLP
ncbi:hypothetical protein WI89_30335 [Burkholderia ubonensis]|uniref:hypothetical protein n=1 Tax=Burkholderia ubonensis TaxID=101571 RepID=UPI000752A292|nr:hypothetical protein [Burkholderia ubonensis]KVD79120.1 hypothetical protein WI89_30335 [Burkholderia ubonensis]